MWGSAGGSERSEEGLVLVGGAHGDPDQASEASSVLVEAAHGDAAGEEVFREALAVTVGDAHQHEVGLGGVGGEARVFAQPFDQDCALGDDGRAASDAIALRPLLRRLAAERDVSTLLVEAGPRLLGAFFRQGLVNEALVFVAPILLGDRGRPSVAGVSPERLGDAIRLEVMDQRLRGGDLVVRLRQPTGG